MVVGDVTFTVNVTGVPRDIDVGLTVAVAVQTVTAAAEGKAAGKNKPNEATTVAKATARTREAMVRRRGVMDARQRKGACGGFSLR